MKLVESQFDKNDNSMQALTARNEVLQKSIDAQKQKIETLRSALANAAESFGENDRRTQNWQIQLNNAQAELNSQLGIYGLYAYKLFASVYPIKKIRLVIYQERIHSIDDQTVSIEDLLEWEIAVLRPAEKEEQNPNAEAVSGKWCKYCPGINVCRQRSKDALSINVEKKPELMTDAEIEELLPKLDFIIDYCASIKDYTLKKAIEGKKWKGYVLSEFSTKRKISDEEAVKRILKEAGYCPEVSKLIINKDNINITKEEIKKIFS